MSSENERIFCDYVECPIKHLCNNFKEYIRKDKRSHWGLYPYPHKNKDGDCIGFESKEPESPNELNIISNV